LDATLLAGGGYQTTRGDTVKHYETPCVLARYSIAELLAQAAVSLTYISDGTLKRGIETIGTTRSE